MINSKIGLLGGGQLGRMLIQSAIDFNLDIVVLDPDPEAPCRPFASSFTCGSLTDYEIVYKFGKQCELITIEIENVNTDALATLEAEGIAVYPNPSALRIIQNKINQKQFYVEQGIPTAEFYVIENREQLREYQHFLPAVQKLATAGYDGKGVLKLNSDADFETAFDSPSVLEKRVDIEKEISVIVARSVTGRVVVYPPVELVYHDRQNMVDYLISPAQILDEQVTKCNHVAISVIEKLQMVGLLAVELFLTKTGEILVNEVAPRPHNSGHHTIKASLTSQFEQHWRAILGLPLGATASILPSAMINLLGEPGNYGPAQYQNIEKALEIEGVYVHLYGKKITKPYRKMGHITILATDFQRLNDKIAKVRGLVKVISHF